MAIIQFSSGLAVAESQIRRISPVYALSRTRSLEVLAGIHHHGKSEVRVRENYSIKVEWLLLEEGSSEEIIISSNEVSLMSETTDLLSFVSDNAEAYELEDADTLVINSSIKKIHKYHHMIHNPEPVDEGGTAPNTAEQIHHRLENRVKVLDKSLKDVTHENRSLMNTKNWKEVNGIIELKKLLEKGALEISEDQLADLRELPVTTMISPAVQSNNAIPYFGENDLDHFMSRENPEDVHDEIREIAGASLEEEEIVT